MENPIVRTIIKERDDYKFIKCFDKVGDEWATNITYFEAECKNCDYVQHGNRENIIEHLKLAHNKEYED